MKRINLLFYSAIFSVAAAVAATVTADSSAAEENYGTTSNDKLKLETFTTEEEEKKRFLRSGGYQDIFDKILRDNNNKKLDKDDAMHADERDERITNKTDLDVLRKKSFTSVTILSNAPITEAPRKKSSPPSKIEGCSVCGDGQMVGNKYAIFEFEGQPSIQCGILEMAGKQGFIPSEQCVFLPIVIDSVCECQEEEKEEDPIEEQEQNNHTKDFFNRIVGGEAAEAGEFPFMVSWHDYSLSSYPACGGSLISPNLVLTAAHCAGISGGVRVGSLKARSLYYDSSPTGVEAGVIAQIRHPQYNGYTISNDYMILVLDQDIDTSIYTPIELNFDAEKPNTGDLLTTIGFGTLSSGGIQPDTLMKVNVPANDHATCSSQYGGDIIEEIHLCAGYPEGGKDSCQGDSGGPIFKEIDGVFTQVGIVSFGIGCALPGYSGVYARVSGASFWLKEEICNRSSEPKPSFCEGFVPTPLPPSPIRPPVYRPTSSCIDYPIGWVDSAGDNCGWYIGNGVCAAYGNSYPNNGFTANEVCCVCGGGLDERSQVPSTSSLPSLEPTYQPSDSPSRTNSPTDEPSHQPTFVPSETPSTKPTLVPSKTQFPSQEPTIQPSTRCIDSPLGWYDISGSEFDCKWYAVAERCAIYGNGSQNNGKTANEACCACGGGVDRWISEVPSTSSLPTLIPSFRPTFAPSKTPTSQPSSVPTKTQVPSLEPTLQPSTRCIDSPLGWYDSDGSEFDCKWYAVGERCSDFGDSYENNGKTANEVCCTCGGGIDRGISEIPSAPSPPTLIPSMNQSPSPSLAGNITLFPVPLTTSPIAPTPSPLVVSSPADPTLSPDEPNNELFGFLCTIFGLFCD